MTDLLTAAQMRTLEQAAIASGRVTGLELMERAGRSVVEAIFQEWLVLRATSHRAVVLCGPGNNGDGFVVARLLRERGWEVAVFCTAPPDRLPPDARANYDRWQAIGAVAPLDALDWPLLRKTDITIDALFGIGLQRPLAQAFGARWRWQKRPAPGWWPSTRPRACAPSSGRMRAEEGIGPDHPADLTVTFHSQLGPAICWRKGPRAAAGLWWPRSGLRPPQTACRRMRPSSWIEETTIDPGALG